MRSDRVFEVKRGRIEIMDLEPCGGGIPGRVWFGNSVLAAGGTPAWRREAVAGDRSSAWNMFNSTRDSSVPHRRGQQRIISDSVFHADGWLFAPLGLSPYPTCQWWLRWA